MSKHKPCFKGHWIFSEANLGKLRSSQAESSSELKILFLSRWLPFPVTNGSKLRIYNLLRGLSEQHHVTLLSFIDPSESLAKDSCLYSICERVETVTHKRFNPKSWQARRGFLNKTPRWVMDTFSVEMKEWINKLLSEEQFDIIIASQIDTAIYSRHFGNVPALFDEADPGILYDNVFRQKTPLSRLRYGLTWRKHARFLANLLPDFIACTVVSDREKNLLSKTVPDYQLIEVIPNFVNLAENSRIEAEKQPDTLIFTGSLNYSPNRDAMSWFLREIYPRIQSAVPEVRLLITGDSTGRPLPPAQNVELTGMVEDVRPIVAASSVSLSPIRIGGGTRLKILEAMALKVPVVSTSKGAEGLSIQHDKNILLADTPEQFGDAVISLLMDEKRRRLIGENGFRLVQDRYDYRVVMPRFLELVEKVASVKLLM